MNTINAIDNGQVMSSEDLDLVAGGSLRGQLGAMAGGAAAGAIIGGLTGGLGGAANGALEGATLAGVAYVVSKWFEE